MENKTIKPWTIYLWRNGDKMEGASPVVTRDGIKGIYCHGWEIEKDPEARRNEDKHQAWRAKVKVKNLLNNTLNVINWYGSKVLDDRGNIDTLKLQVLEATVASKLAKENLKIDSINKRLKKGEEKLKETDLNDVYPIKKFPIKDITIQEAFEYGFIGDELDKRFINKHGK